MQLVLEKLFEENPDLISDFLAESIRRGEKLIEMLRKEREGLKAKYKQRLKYLG
jgi:archaellum biogenesis protein FlaJ (TadC family)